MCEYRPVNDCPCGQTFRARERATHELDCLPFLKQKLPRVREQRDKANAAVRELTAAARALRDESAERDVATASSMASSLLIGLTLLSIGGQLVRPDASVPVALTMLVAVQARDTLAIRATGATLP